jgi:adenosine deaminase
MSFIKLPKVELHLHLDCSLSYQLVQKLRPETSYQAYHQSFIAPPKCPDLADYITRAVAAIILMQTRENLHLAVFDLFEQLQRDQVIYAEMRFAPLEHTKQGLSPDEVVATVDKATKEAIGKTGIQAGIILCTLRHYSNNQSLQTIELVEKFRGTRVVGFDIASDEAGYPIDNHVAAFQLANQRGIQCTAHAGEALGPESVWETLENFMPSRIGHGVRSGEDSKLLEFLKEKEIHLEVCPTSNVQTNVFPKIRDHNIDLLFDSGVSLSVNTDCRTISNVTLESEYLVLSEVFGWDKERFYKCNLEAVKHAFCSEQVRLELFHKLKTGFD